MTSNETSFALFKSIIAEDVDAYVHLSKYIKNFGAMKYLTEWKRAVKSLSDLGFPHLFDNSKTVRRYRDGLIKFVEKS